jgi:hypothetical protein
MCTYKTKPEQTQRNPAIIDDYIFRDCTMLNVIFCESTNKPVGWVDGWKTYCNAQVVCGNDWSFVNGSPQIKEN